MGKRAIKPTPSELRQADSLMQARRLASDVPDGIAMGYSTRVAATLAGISQEGIRKAVMRGTLKATRFKPPGATRASVAIDAASLRDYIARNRRP